MHGDDKVRFCTACSLNVYNVSAMSADEAEEILSKANGRLCVRFYRREDGRILTQDCPVGARNAARRALSWLSVAATAAVAAMLAPWKGAISENQGEVSIPAVSEPKTGKLTNELRMGRVAPAEFMGYMDPKGRSPTKVQNLARQTDVE